MPSSDALKPKVVYPVYLQPEGMFGGPLVSVKLSEAERDVFAARHFTKPYSVWWQEVELQYGSDLNPRISRTLNSIYLVLQGWHEEFCHSWTEFHPTCIGAFLEYGDAEKCMRLDISTHTKVFKFPANCEYDDLSQFT